MKSEWKPMQNNVYKMKRRWWMDVSLKKKSNKLYMQTRYRFQQANYKPEIVSLQFKYYKLAVDVKWLLQQKILSYLERASNH